jgi:ribosome maturation factor RimP
VGRTLIVKTVNENLEAELVEANDDFVILLEAREPKKNWQGKETVQNTSITLWRDQRRIVTVTF